MTRSNTRESLEEATFFRGVVVLEDAALRERPCKDAYDGDVDRLVCTEMGGPCCLWSRFSSSMECVKGVKVHCAKGSKKMHKNNEGCAHLFELLVFLMNFESNTRLCSGIFELFHSLEKLCFIKFSVAGAGGCSSSNCTVTLLQRSQQFLLLIFLNCLDSKVMTAQKWHIM